MSQHVRPIIQNISLRVKILYILSFLKRPLSFSNYSYSVHGIYSIFWMHYTSSKTPTSIFLLSIWIYKKPRFIALATHNFFHDQPLLFWFPRHIKLCFKSFFRSNDIIRELINVDIQWQFSNFFHREHRTTCTVQKLVSKTK